MAEIFKILFQTRDISIFVLHGVSFIRYVQLKSLFSEKKHQRQNPGHTFVEKLSKINMAEY